ncbi:MAG TPA: Gfo/Idh/MocA family oxidoreductase [Planctomycetota bacterium]|nr:Gfo/Idh/MocA family oxidoreductase [Planctomycetota bacterium]
MKLKLAFIGFRHGHIFDLYKRARESDQIEVVAACEEDPAARAKVTADGAARITHDQARRMLDEVDCDAVAVGDYYGARGGHILAALQHGRHVITDKPPCIRLDELDRIEAVVREKKLKLGCMFDTRDLPPFLGLRKLIRDGAIGDIHAITIGGQHPLLRGTRPGWYFEEGKHGGTINDIGIHVFDYLPWLTGLEFAKVEAARNWTALAAGSPMRDGAQFMLTMNNGAGVLGELSYFMPDSMGYTIPLYWRLTVFGRKGVLETSGTSDSIRAGLDGKKQMETLPLPPADPGGYLRAFLNDVRGEARPDEVRTEGVLKAARLALTVQKAADDQRYGVALA